MKSFIFFRVNAHLSLSVCVLTLVVLWVLKRSTWNIVNPGRLLREELSFPKPFPSCCSLSLSSSAPARNCLSSYVSHILTVFKKTLNSQGDNQKIWHMGSFLLKVFFFHIFFQVVSWHLCLVVPIEIKFLIGYFVVPKRGWPEESH